MSANSFQTEQVRTKVLFSEVDTPFNGYLDILGKVTKLTNQVLTGQLENYETDNKVEFNEQFIDGLVQVTDLKFLELQSSIDVKKVAEENWEQANNDTIERMEDQLESKIPEMRDSYISLQDRIARVRKLYAAVSKVNSEMETLLESNTSLSTTKSEWEHELGPELTEKLIKQNYLRKSGKSNGEDRYRVYDNFTKGPKELKHINKSIKSDIDRLSQELDLYKQKWLQDADIFTRITSVLREELAKRDMDVDVEMDEDDDQDEREDGQEIERYRRQRSISVEAQDSEKEPDEQASNDMADEDHEEIAEPTDEEVGGQFDEDVSEQYDEETDGRLDEVTGELGQETGEQLNNETGAPIDEESHEPVAESLRAPSAEDYNGDSEIPAEEHEVENESASFTASPELPLQGQPE